jgi:hypothetical protein
VRKLTGLTVLAALRAAAAPTADAAKRIPYKGKTPRRPHGHFHPGEGQAVEVPTAMLAEHATAAFA